jgi:predicted nucleic acid-binding protein
MKYLLDVSTLVACLWPRHVFHAKTITWLKGKQVAVCPITELGFIRVSTSARFGATISDARAALQSWLQTTQPDFIPCDLRALDGLVAPSSAKTTDWYLANLADKHGMKWATLDAQANHPAAELI